MAHLDGLGHYPKTQGIPALRETIASWLMRRFALPAGSVNPERHVLPVSGTREALFSFAQAVIDRSRKPLVLMPNPFYQIYEGAALLAGAEPHYLACGDNGLPDYHAIPDAVWARCQLLYVCSPGNPTGAVTDLETLIFLLGKAIQHDFVIAADECYSEIYFDEQNPPPGMLEACHAAGLDDYQHCVVFHSLSKRSNVPGLRSGFVAGDAAIIERYHLYRTYHGCAMGLPTQYASIAAWGDEQHVIANRAAYKRKFEAALGILGDLPGFAWPDAAFYLWPQLPFDALAFTRALYEQEHVTVLPGQFLSREHRGHNPGSNRVRIALVANETDCLDAAHRIRRVYERMI
jgi:N-succinyldiaminopimelate aminotransferase